MPDGIPLDRSAHRVVRRSRTVLVATVSRRGRPFLTPVWFVWRGSEVVLTTGPGSWTGRNITANGRATLIFGGEDGSPARVVVSGPARCVHGTGPLVRLLVRLLPRYYLSPAALADQVRHRRLLGLRLAYYAAAPSTTRGYLVVRAAHVELVDAA